MYLYPRFLNNNETGVYQVNEKCPRHRKADQSKFVDPVLTYPTTLIKYYI